MDIVAALFVEGIDLRSAFDGGPTLIDLTGVHFSAPAPSPPPVTVAPHLVVIVRCPAGDSGTGVLECTFWRGEERIASNVQPLQVDPGKFTYRLVRAELDMPELGTIEARCRVDQGPHTTVPYTLVEGPAKGAGDEAGTAPDGSDGGWRPAGEG
jgi:hypothetical protein